MGRHGTCAEEKEAQDRKRAASFTKLVRLITVGIAMRRRKSREFNVALKHAIEKAKAINMPNDNINQYIKKGSGADGSANFETLSYEGYGPKIWYCNYSRSIDRQQKPNCRKYQNYF